MALFRRQKVARDDHGALREWVAAHDDVEAYLEPRTSMSPTTVVLVAGDGEFTRRQVATPRSAADFAQSVGIPIYDTNRVGLPQRMRDYAVRQQNGQRSPSTFLSGVERDAVQTIADAAAQPMPVVTPGREELRTLLRSARANAHPDRNDGDRTAWDTVEDAANVLRLT
jgi:hypothetical protein